MNPIKFIQNKMSTRKQEEIHRQAEESITVSDFENSLFIAFNGVPLFPIQKNSTSEDIITQLASFRQNYINSMMKDYQ